MRGFVAPTDFDWFRYLRAFEPPADEVNFWKPGSGGAFGALDPGEPFFFKLKIPHNAIGGFGYFAHFSQLPASIAWDVYGRGHIRYSRIANSKWSCWPAPVIAQPRSGDI